jgi:hypothetical protein
MPQLRDLIIFDHHGEQRFISTYFPPPRINVKDRPYFIALEGGAEIATYGPYIGRNSGRYSYAIGRRLSGEGGSFAGVAFAALEPAFLQDFCWSNRLSDDFESVLINARGEIVASCRPTDLSRQSPIIGKPAGDLLFDGQLLQTSCRKPADQRQRPADFRIAGRRLFRPAYPDRHPGSDPARQLAQPADRTRHPRLACYRRTACRRPAGSAPGAGNGGADCRTGSRPRVTGAAGAIGDAGTGRAQGCRRAGQQGKEPLSRRRQPRPAPAAARLVAVRRRSPAPGTQRQHPGTAPPGTFDITSAPANCRSLDITRLDVPRQAESVSRSARSS